ncbi:MAG: hypothetical protein FWF77_02925 [Defluviitaleaceae bacterium]|nr:hypothetical protein [Defluviitaleaceae bacterium]
MCRRRRIPSKPGAVYRSIKSAPSARWAPGICVGGDAFPRSRRRFAGVLKARQARGGHRGICVGGDAFPRSRRRFAGVLKARQARGGHRGYVSAATHSLEAGGGLPEY